MTVKSKGRNRIRDKAQPKKVATFNMLKEHVSFIDEYSKNNFHSNKSAAFGFVLDNSIGSSEIGRVLKSEDLIMPLGATVLYIGRAVEAKDVQNILVSWFLHKTVPITLNVHGMEELYKSLMNDIEKRGQINSYLQYCRMATSYAARSFFDALRHHMNGFIAAKNLLNIAINSEERRVLIRHLNDMIGMEYRVIEHLCMLSAELRFAVMFGFTKGLFTAPCDQPAWVGCSGAILAEMNEITLPIGG